MTSSRSALWTAAFLATLAMAGCSGEPEPDEAMANVEAAQSIVVEELKDAATALMDAGFGVENLGGSFVGCGGSTLDGKGVEFAGGGVVTGVEGDVDQRIGAVAGALGDAGWDLRVTTFNGQKSTRLTRDGVELSIDPSQREDLDDIPVFGVRGTCVDVTTDQLSEFLLTEDQTIEL